MFTKNDESNMMPLVAFSRNVLFRPYKSSLRESIETAREFPNIGELAKYLMEAYPRKGQTEADFFFDISRPRCNVALGMFNEYTVWRRKDKNADRRISEWESIGEFATRYSRSVKIKEGRIPPFAFHIGRRVSLFRYSEPSEIASMIIDSMMTVLFTTGGAKIWSSHFKVWLPKEQFEYCKRARVVNKNWRGKDGQTIVEFVKGIAENAEFEVDDSLRQIYDGKDAFVVAVLPKKNAPVSVRSDGLLDYDRDVCAVLGI